MCTDGTSIAGNVGGEVAEADSAAEERARRIEAALANLNAEVTKSRIFLDRIWGELRFANLGPERIIEFLHRDQRIKMWLPYAQTDWVQAHIMRDRDFFEHALLARLRTMLQGRTVVADIGANIGNHSIYFAKICGAQKVVAFEPQVSVLGILRRNVQLNDLDRVVDVQPFALGDRPGGASMSRYRTNNLGATSLTPVEGDGEFEVRTLDSYALGALDCMKVDVEGGQMPLLEGAKETLSQHRPLIIMEIDQGQGEYQAPVDFLTRLGYSISPLDTTNYLFTP